MRLSREQLWRYYRAAQARTRRTRAALIADVNAGFAGGDAANERITDLLDSTDG